MNRILVFCSLLLLLFASCTTARYPNVGGEFKIYPFTDLGIPKGHLPPPKECKIWIPGKEAGQQGPPQSCPSAIANAPLGAWVITHEGNRYRVNILSREKRSIVEEVRYYALEN